MKNPGSTSVSEYSTAGRQGYDKNCMANPLCRAFQSLNGTVHALFLSLYSMGLEQRKGKFSNLARQMWVLFCIQQWSGFQWL